MYRPMPIDHTLCTLERIAHSKGLQLEDVSGYVELCEFLTAIEYGEQPLTWISKQDTLEILKRIITYVAPGWIGRELEFHLSCQPKEG